MSPSRTRSTFFRLLCLGVVGISTLLCVACLVGWILSYLLPEEDLVSVYRYNSRRKVQLVYKALVWNERPALESGRAVTIDVYPGFLNVELFSVIEYLGESPPVQRTGIPWVFSYRRARQPTDEGLYATYMVEFYLWLPTLLFAIYPFIVFVHRPRRRLRRLRRGLCLTCGYDVTSGGQTVCPECGTASASDHPTAAIPGGEA